MKILVLSDTHGRLDKVYDIYEKLGRADMLIHCGDNIADAHRLEDTLGIPTVAVGGNCDGVHRPSWEFAETPYGKILVTHGHTEGAGYNESLLLYEAEENDCVAVCFGHTHVPVCEDMNGIWLINPGSLSLPRDGSNGSYAVIHSEEDDFYANIVFYDTVCGPSKNKKASGGFLRGILNYSDRL